MKPLCEHMTSQILPGFRALVAKKLIEDHGLSQTKVAELLDTTQPAISQYKRDLRGKKILIFKENPNLMKMVDSVTNRIMEGDVNPEDTGLEFCRVCKFMQSSRMVSGNSMC